jgi:hypothetical protein
LARRQRADIALDSGLSTLGIHVTRLAEFFYSLSITLWVGGLMVVGGLVTPVLFAQLPDRALAGNVAGTLFTLLAMIGFVCGAYLVLYLFARRGWRALKSGVLWAVIVMLAFDAAGHFGISPVIAELKAYRLSQQLIESEFAQRFATWHRISELLYGAQTLVGLALLSLQERGKN